jgi:hypothetical protein
MNQRVVYLASVLVGAATMLSHEASAQPLGAFYWQLAPFCNVVAVHITQHVTPSGAVYALTGFDDQCGATERATLVGTAIFNHDGSVGVGLSIVVAPGGAPVHVDARVNLALLSGPWVDSAGNAGTFVPLSPARGEALRLPGSGLTTGSPRPLSANGIAPGSITAMQIAPGAVGATQLAPGAVSGSAIADGSITSEQIAPGAIGAAQIDPLKVQSRIRDGCPVGKYLRGINADGTVVCEPQLTLPRATYATARDRAILDADTLVHSVTLDVPSAGTVLVHASGSLEVVRLTDTPQEIVRVECSISLGTTLEEDFEVDVVLAVSAPNVVQSVPLGLARGFDVLPGTFKANLVCRHSIQGRASVDKPSLTALFVPAQ